MDGLSPTEAFMDRGIKRRIVSRHGALCLPKSNASKIAIAMSQAQTVTPEYTFCRFDIEHSKEGNSYIARLIVFPRDERTGYSQDKRYIILREARSDNCVLDVLQKLRETGHVKS